MTRHTRRIAQANSAALDRQIRANGYTPPLSEWDYGPGMVTSGPETGQGATTSGYPDTAKGGSNWSAQTGDFSTDTHTHGLDDYTCRERLVGDCVIEREVAEAVAREREAIAAMCDDAADRSGARKRVRDGIDLWFGEPDKYEAMEVAYRDVSQAIRAGAHNEGVR